MSVLCDVVTNEMGALLRLSTRPRQAKGGGHSVLSKDTDPFARDRRSTWGLQSEMKSSKWLNRCGSSERKFEEQRQAVRMRWATFFD
jgi:hypothetical protein